jgi:hypothetical protein
MNKNGVIKKFGICLVCGADIVEELMPFQSLYVCNGCGIAYSKITDKTKLNHSE